MFRNTILVITALLISKVTMAESPCAGNPVYRQFDFWVGEWEAFRKDGKKAGDSRITVILDSCIVLEEWTSVNNLYG